MYCTIMNTIFMNSKKSKTSGPHRLLLNLTDKIDWKRKETSDHYRLLLNLTDKIDWRRKDKHITLLNININYTWKNIKKVI